MSVTMLLSPQADARTPPHFHEPRVHPADRKPEPVALAQHDLTYCLHGRIQVWVGDQCRIIGPGDAVSIPPGTVHSSQMLAHRTELLAPVVPPGWVRFLESFGPAYHGPAYPPVDDSPPPPPGTFERMVAEGLLTPVSDYRYTEPRFDAPDDRLPDGPAPYFLRAGQGPRHTLFGQICFQVLTGLQSGGRMAMTVTEGPKGPPLPTHLHEHTYEGIFCVDGRMWVTTDGEEQELIAGDFVSIPQGVEHSYRLGANFNRFVTTIAPAGIERFFELAGEVAAQRIFPPSAAPPDYDKLAEAATQIDLSFSDGP